MGLFKNDVGRPSNETIRKRRQIYVVIVLALVALVGVGVTYTVSYFKTNYGASVSSTSKNAIGKKELHTLFLVQPLKYQFLVHQ